MDLTLNIISKSLNTGIFIISNKSGLKHTDWEILLQLKNFTIKSMDNINFVDEGNDIYRFTPKEWKINIESETHITSNFTYQGDSKFLYNILEINSIPVEPEKPKGISFTIENTTNEPIVINPGEKYTFTI